MHFTTRSFFGHTDSKVWSQFWENEPDDPKILSARGHLFGIINLGTDENKEASAIGHELINQINIQYFALNSFSIKEHLTNTVENIASRHLHQCQNLSLVIAVNHNQNLYLVSFNSGQVIFQRGVQVSNILKSLPSKTSFIAGQVKDNDKILLTTDGFLESYSWEKIKNFLSLGKIQDIEENFLAELYSFPDQSNLGAALIQFHEDDLSVSPESTTEMIENTSNLETVSNEPRRQSRNNIFLNYFKKIISQKDSYVPHLESTNITKRRHFNIIVAITILVALGISVALGAKKTHQNQIEQKYQSLKTQFETKINNANTVKNINLSDAQKVAQESEAILKSMSELKVHSDEISKFQENVRTLLSQTGSSSDYEPDKFFDTSLINSEAKFTKLAIVNNNLYLLDSTNGRIDQIDITNKSKQSIFSNDSLKGVTNFAVDKDNVYVLKDQKIYYVDGKNLVSKIDLTEKLKNLTSSQISFWNGSLYLLANFSDADPSIWKFTPNSSGFDSGSVWLKTGESLPQNPAYLAINGQIWVISNNGTIIPFTHGAHTDFKAKTEGVTFTNASNLVTAPESEILAFTDKDNLVYVYNKSGESLYNYNYGSKKILSLAFDQNSKTIFVLCNDGEIYKIPLQ